MPLMIRNKRSAAPAIGTHAYRVVLAIALGLCAAAVGDDADTAGPKILLLRGTRSSELDLASRRESSGTDAVVDNELRTGDPSPDAPTQTNPDSAERQPPVLYPAQPLPEGLDSKPLRSFWTPGKDVDRPDWRGEIRAASYVSESPPLPHSEATREEPQVAGPPRDLARVEERNSPIPHLLLSISLVTSIAALGLAIAFRTSGLRRDATIHVELAGPSGTYLAAAPSGHSPTSASETVPARATTIADFADSQFAAASLLGPTFGDQRQSEELRQRSQESAILETLFEENLRLRQDLRKPAAESSAASGI